MMCQHALLLSIKIVATPLSFIIFMGALSLYNSRALLRNGGDER